MTATAETSFAWGDGHYTFRLPIKQLLELEELCNAGAREIYARLIGGTWRFRDMRETIRLGLIGGGLPAVKALALVELYVDPPVPLEENLLPAQAILLAALVGVPSDQPNGGQGAGKAARKAMAPAASPRANSTEPAARSATRPAR